MVLVTGSPLRSDILRMPHPRSLASTRSLEGGPIYRFKAIGHATDLMYTMEGMQGPRTGHLPRPDGFCSGSGSTAIRSFSLVRHTYPLLPPAGWDLRFPGEALWQRPASPVKLRPYHLTRRGSFTVEPSRTIHRRLAMTTMAAREMAASPMRTGACLRRGVVDGGQGGESTREGVINQRTPSSTNSKVPAVRDAPFRVR